LYGAGLEVVGILEKEQTVKITRPGNGVQTVTLAANERVKVRG